MAVPPTALEKLRRKMRESRLYYSKNNVFRASVELNECIAPNIVGLYRPIGGEPDTAPIAAAFNCPKALPFLPTPNAAMQFRLWSAGDPTIRAPWGGEQPDMRAAEAKPDVIFVPLVAFDAEFNRIGQGGGHYDRYLAAHPDALRIGVAWELQKIDAIEPRPWDVPLDAVLTEKSFYVKDLSRCQHL